MSGRLFIIATPIGNLGDLTPRAAEALAGADLVLAEDTRISIKLLNHLGLKKKMMSCHDHNEASRLGLIEELAGQGAQVALVCDAGTPVVSDPGYRLVERAVALGMEVVPIPGACALLAALVASGLPGQRFVFEGFLPDRKGERARRLAELRSEPRTMVFYVAPHDLGKVLPAMAEQLGDRQACLARELTKRFEEFIRGSLLEIAAEVQSRSVLGECVLVVSGAADAAEPVDEAVVTEELRIRLSQGARLKEAAAEVAMRYGWSKAAVYRLGLSIKES